MILDDPERAVARYNQVGVHYNLVAEGIYRERTSTDPFSEEYELFIIAGLLAFDMGRMMGRGDKYTVEARNFRSRLRAKMRAIRPVIGDLPSSSLTQVDLAACGARLSALMISSPRPVRTASTPILRINFMLELPRSCTGSRPLSS